MSFGKRAVLYLTRKKGRTILLTVLMFVMSCFVLIGISLKSSADKEIERLRHTLETSFILSADFENESYFEEKEGENGEQYKIFVGPKITDKIIKQIIEIDGVKEYTVCLSDLIWTDLELKSGIWSNTDESDADAVSLMEEELEMWRHVTNVVSCVNGETDINFRTGAINISRGRNIEKEDCFKAVISEQLAKTNKLTVGDIFIIESKEGMYHSSTEPLKRRGETIELEIVGLFRMNFKQKASEYAAETDLLENIIYTDMNTRTAIRKNERNENPDTDFCKVTFFVKDYVNCDLIIKQIKEKVNMEGLLLEKDDSTYKASVKPLRLISVFAVLLLITGIVGIGIILYLIMCFWVKERKQEMGILLSIGIRKKNMIVQMFLENLIVAAVVLILSISFSGVMVDKCARMAENLTAPKTNTENYIVTPPKIETMPIATKTSSEKVELDHDVSFETIFFTVIVVCGVSSVSVIFSSRKVLRMEPKKLLQSM